MQGSLPSRGAWIEMITDSGKNLLSQSLPSRGAWIEMFDQGLMKVNIGVAPLTGSVD